MLIGNSLRGFLVIFELIQLIKLAMVSLRRFVFSHTPRTIREMTRPEYFPYAIGEPFFPGKRLHLRPRAQREEDYTNVSSHR